jgi:hypothetical protein
MLGLRKFPEHFLGLRGFQKSPKIPGTFQKPGIWRNPPKNPEDFRSLAGLLRNPPGFSGGTEIPGIPDFFDSRPAGSRTSSRRSFSNESPGFLKIPLGSRNGHTKYQLFPSENPLRKVSPGLNQLNNSLNNSQNPLPKFILVLKHFLTLALSHCSMATVAL